MNVNDPASIQEVNSFGGQQVRALDYSPDQHYLAAGMLDGSVKVLDKKISAANFRRLNELAGAEDCTVNQLVSKLIRQHNKGKA